MLLSVRPLVRACVGKLCGFLVVFMCVLSALCFGVVGVGFMRVLLCFRVVSYCAVYVLLVC